MLKYFLFVLIPISFYAQNSKNIQFNKFGIIYKEGANGLDSLNVLKADVTTKYGKFTIQIIDNNKNGKFNDYKKEDSTINRIYDGFHISKYNSEFIPTIFDPISVLKERTKFVINGIVFELFNLIRDDKGLYKAKIKNSKKNINYKLLFDNKSLIFADKLNSICVFDSNNNKVNLKKILKKKKLYIFPINTNLDVRFPNLYNITKAEETSLVTIDLIYVIVQSEHSTISNFIKLRKLNHKVFYIKKDDYKNLFLLGYNEIHRGILFNKKGGVIDDRIFSFDIHKYDN